MTVGRDGNLWYATATGIDRIDEAGGVVNLFGFTGTLGLSGASDGATWGVSSDGPIWRNDLANGTTYVPIPTLTGKPSQVADCVSQSGHVFFSEYDGDKIGLGYTDPLWTFTELPLAAGSHPFGVACAADGTVWYTAPGTNKVGYWNPATAAHEEFAIPTSGAFPLGITVAPGGAVWFTESAGVGIGRLELRPNGDVNGDGKVTVSDVFYLINYLFAGGSAPVP